MTRAFALHRIRIMTADQLHQFLRVHLVAVRIISMLLRHRAMGAPRSAITSSFFGSSAGTEPTFEGIMGSSFAWQVDRRDRANQLPSMP
jgi:hypothetical protein